MSVNLESVLKNIQSEKNTKLTANNLRYGVNCMGVQGILKPVTIEGGDVGTQLFLQNETPTALDGIWINTNKQINDIYLENERYIQQYDTIFSDQATSGDENMLKGRVVPSSMMGSTYCQRGNKLHIFGFYSSTTSSQNVSPKINQHYTYDFDTDTWTQLPDCPTPQGFGCCEWVDDDTIYIFGTIHADCKGYVYKYTISTDSYELINNLDTITSSARQNYASYPGACCYDNNGSIYYIGYFGTWKLFKYDITNNTFSQITTSGSNIVEVYTSNLIYREVNNYRYLYWFQGSMTSSDYIRQKFCRLNLDTGAIAAPGSQYITLETYAFGRLFFDGQYIYAILQTKSTASYAKRCLRLDVTKFSTDSYAYAINRNNSYYSYMVDSYYPTGLFHTDTNDVIASCGIYNKTSAMAGLLLRDKTYELENDTIIIYTDTTVSAGCYSTEIFKSERVLNGKMKQAFTDVNIYDKTEDKIIKNLSTYYGNGTDWIQIK